jgi:altronate dehydratase small subunit
MLRKSMMIHPDDSVAMVLEDSKKGDTIKTSKGIVTLAEDVEFAHKVAVVPLEKGAPVIKYHEEIGYMLKDASPGTWIHNHNMGCDRGKV